MIAIFFDVVMLALARGCEFVGMAPIPSSEGRTSRAPFSRKIFEEGASGRNLGRSVDAGGDMR
jgi:hypothetical protein